MAWEEALSGSLEVKIVHDKALASGTIRVYADVIAERERQDAKHGSQSNHTLHEWLGILTEEVGEVAKAINEAHWYHGNYDPYRKELIEVAATAIAAVECYDRKKGRPTIEDGFGSVWPRDCATCGTIKQVVRPGKIQCPNGCTVI